MQINNGNNSYFPLVPGKPGFVFLKTKNLGPHDYIYRKIKSALEISSFEVTTFAQMESIYAFRGPLVKGPDLFATYLRILAKDYQETGVDYVELSISDVVTNPKYLEIAHDVLPKIEAETGVKIRFKAAMWRHTDLGENANFMRRVIAINSPYVVGVDFMGEETNSTKEFEVLIRQAENYRRTFRPHLAIQVHAGESEAFPTNVADAIYAGGTQIGHGIQGITEEVLEDALNKHTIIQINLNSNLSLSNIPYIKKLGPVLKKYLKKGVKLTFGTDGHGLYQTSSLSEYEAARSCGLGIEEFEIIKSDEALYKAMMDKAFKEEMISMQGRPLFMPEYFTVEGSGPHWEQWSKLRKMKIEQIQKEAVGKQIQVLADNKELVNFEIKKTPIYIALPDATQWAQMGLEQSNHYMEMVKNIIKGIDPNKAFLVTDGTLLGGNSLLYAEDINPRGVKILGISHGEVQPGTISQLNSGLFVAGNNLGERNSQLLNFLKQRKGTIIAIDGGIETKEMLQMARNIIEEEASSASATTSATVDMDAQPPVPPSLKVFIYEGSRDIISDQLRPKMPQSFFNQANYLKKIFGSETKESIEVAIAGDDELPIRKPNYKNWPPYCNPFQLDELEGFYDDDKDLTQNFPKLTDLYEYYNFQPSQHKPSHKTKSLTIDALDPSAHRIFHFAYNAEIVKAQAPTPEPVRSIVSQSMFIQEFAEQSEVFGYDPTKPFPYDLKSIYTFFSQMTDDQILNYLKAKLHKGKNVLQTLAKLCAFLDHFAVTNLDELTFPKEMNSKQEGIVVSPKPQGPLQKLEAQEQLLSPFTKETDLVSPTLQGNLSTPQALGPVHKKQLIIIRGPNDYNQTALRALDAIRQKGFKPYGVATDAHINQIKLEGARSVPPIDLSWPVIRDESIRRNKKTVKTLMEGGADYIVYSDLNRQKVFMEDYVKLAQEHGYEVVIVKSGSISTLEDSLDQDRVALRKKYLEDYLRPGETLDEPLDFNTVQVEQCNADKFILQLPTAASPIVDLVEDVQHILNDPH